jgi:Flp pilus assembly CpaF family ATPase
MMTRTRRRLSATLSRSLNIVIAGGTGSGKTTLTNAVIAEIVAHAPEDRLVILEDTAEIQCTADNAVCLHTSDTIDMARLLEEHDEASARSHHCRRSS